MTADSPTLQDVLFALPTRFWASPDISVRNKKVLRTVRDCGTGRFGFLAFECLDCDHVQYKPRGCHNRNCPSCICSAGKDWVDIQKQKVLPTHYFHVILTLPNELRNLAKHNNKLLYKLLITTAGDTVLHFFNNREDDPCIPAILQVLHTWNQKLAYHPHVHMLVSGGGYDPQNDRWVPCKNPTFLVPGADMAAVFRDKLLEQLRKPRVRAAIDLAHTDLQHLHDHAAFDKLLDDLEHVRWNAHIKPPFGGPLRVLHYLGQYTHKTAISNARILEVNDSTVTFAYFDRKDAADPKRTMTLDVEDFVRRLLLHVLPKGFHKIRGRGLLAPGNNMLLRAAQVAANRSPEVVDQEPPVLERKKPEEPYCCDNCSSTRLRHIASLLPAPGGDFVIHYTDLARGPPASICAGQPTHA